MFDRRGLALAALFFPLFSFGASPLGDPLDRLQLDLRLETGPTIDDKVDETLNYRHAWFTHLETEGAVRIAQSGLGMSALQYKAEVVAPLLASWVTLIGRFTHSSYFDPGLSFTHLAGLVRLRAPLGPAEIFLAGGKFKRFTRLAGSSPAPTFDGSFSESDWLALIGARVGIGETLSAQAWLANYDGVDCFNFHNPGVQLAVTYLLTPDLVVSVFSRYKILLGFGRRDTLLFGAGLNLPLALGE